MAVVKSISEKFKEVCNRNLKSEMRCQAVSWQLLKFHCDVCIYLADVFYGVSSGDEDETVSSIKKLNSFLSENEDFYQEVFRIRLLFRRISISL